MTSRLPGDQRPVTALAGYGLDVSAGSGVCLYLLTRDGASVSVNIGIFWGIGIGWTKTQSIGIFWGIGIGWTKIHSIGINIFWGIGIGKNKTDPPSLLLTLVGRR